MSHYYPEYHEREILWRARIFPLAIKVISVIAFILVGLCLVFFGLPSHAAVGTANLVNDGGFMPHGFGAVWLSLAVVMFSFGGIEMISISAAEAKDPARSVRSSAKAMMIRLATVLCAGAVYCGVDYSVAFGGRAGGEG